MAWLRSLPGLHVIDTLPTKVGNLDATEIHMRLTGDKPVFLVPPLDTDAPNPQPYGFGVNPGDPDSAGEFTAWYLVEDVSEEGPLWATYYAENPEFLPALEDLLAGLEFSPSM